MRLLPRFSLVEWFVILAICGWFSTFAYEELLARRGARDGHLDADADIALNSLKLKYAGKPPYFRDQMVAIYRDRYEISLEYIGDCCPSSYRNSYNRAYNERMMMVIKDRYPDFDSDETYESNIDLAEKRHRAEWDARY